MNEEHLFETSTELIEFRDEVNRIKKEIRKIIVGQEKMVELMIAALLSDGHILIEGVPGVAKTLAAKLLARSLDTEYSRMTVYPGSHAFRCFGNLRFQCTNS